MQTSLVAVSGAIGGAIITTLGLQHVQRDLARMRRAYTPLSCLSSVDLLVVARDPYSPTPHRIAATEEYEQRTSRIKKISISRAS
jgi:hypothetical protein